MSRSFRIDLVLTAGLWAAAASLIALRLTGQIDWYWPQCGSLGVRGPDPPGATVTA